MSPHTTRSSSRANQGKLSAKLGTLLIVVSNCLLIAPHFTALRFEMSTYTVLGGMSTVGFVMCFAAVTKYRYKQAWIFWFMLCYALFLLISPPVGTTLGIFTIIYLFKRRNLFFVKEPQASA